MRRRGLALVRPATEAEDVRRRSSIMQAMQRASQSPTFFDGLSAIVEVAKADGVWNWVLVGPSPKYLSLSGGGPGGIQEMKHSIGKHAHSFGLLRLTFSAGEATHTRFLFIHASDSKACNFSMKQRGEAMMMEPEMERVIQKFCPWSAKVRIHSEEDCTIEYLCENLRLVDGSDRDLFTPQNCTQALQQRGVRKEPSAMRKDRSDRISEEGSTAAASDNPSGCEDEEQLLEQDEDEEEEEEAAAEALAPPEEARSELAAPEPEVAQHSLATPPPKQRKSVFLYREGDQVEVWSLKHQKWIKDAEVSEVVLDSCNRDGFKIRAGSVKVLYNNRARFKWVAPQEVEELLRLSRRPKPPTCMVGKLLKETHSAEGSEWRLQHVELNKGFLQWWSNQEDARLGKKATGSAYLLGLQQHADETGMFRIRTDNTRGTVYTFRLEAASEDEVQDWTEALWGHAGYCEEVRSFREAEKSKLRGSQDTSASEMPLLGCMDYSKSHSINTAHETEN